jgi:hypothetical protein
LVSQGLRRRKRKMTKRMWSSKEDGKDADFHGGWESR